MATKTSSGWRWLVGGAAFHSPYGLRLQGIVGPMMFRVAPSQLLAHIEIGGLPKAAQILCELHRFVPWREQFHEYRSTSIVHPWGIGHAETLLQTHTHNGSLCPRPIIHADATTGRHLDMGGSQTLHGLLLGIGEQRPECLREMDSFEFCGG